ncbi:hypothetical protein R1sor_026194 [Riccia sorocarpa]|uniref:Ubiquitin-like protease family profile domain-containing protein n=1 Tax=Riccia sorocarpa TaxID=122646 RepID=A0ABD3GCA5_9MARC
MELAIVKFLEEKEKPDARPWETSVFEFSAMSRRLARFLEEVPKNWDKHYDVWLKSREFESWTEDAVRQKGEKPLLIIPSLTMRNDEEKKKWKRTAELWAQWFQTPKSIKDHACTSAKYKACESMSDNTIRFISKDSFTRRDETTRLGVGGAGRTHQVGVVDEELVPVLRAHDVVHYALKIWHGEEGDTKVHEKCIREMMAIPESHSTIIRPIGLSKDKKKPTLLFPLWNGGTFEKYINLEKRSRGQISPERTVSPLIKRSMVFVGIGDLGWAQSFEEVQKDFDPYLITQQANNFDCGVHVLYIITNFKMIEDEKDGKLLEYLEKGGLPIEWGTAEIVANYRQEVRDLFTNLVESDTKKLLSRVLYRG